jgi:hypothetical protein
MVALVHISNPKYTTLDTHIQAARDKKYQFNKPLSYVLSPSRPFQVKMLYKKVVSYTTEEETTIAPQTCRIVIDYCSIICCFESLLREPGE